MNEVIWIIYQPNLKYPQFKNQFIKLMTFTLNYSNFDKKQFKLIYILIKYFEYFLSIIMLTIL